MPLAQNQVFDNFIQTKFTNVIIVSSTLSVAEKFYGTVAMGGEELGPDDYQTTRFFVQDDVEIQTLSGPYAYATDQKINSITEDIKPLQKGFIMRLSDVALNTTQDNIRPILERNIIATILKAIPRDMNYEVINAMNNCYDELAAQGSDKITTWSNVNAVHIEEILLKISKSITNGTDYLPDFAPFIIYSDSEFMARLKNTLEAGSATNPAGMQLERLSVASPTATLRDGTSTMMEIRQKGFQVWSGGKAGLIELNPVTRMEINEKTNAIETKEMISLKNNSGSATGGTLVITMNPAGVQGRYSLFCKVFNIRMETKYDTKSTVIFNHVLNYGMKAYCSPIFTAFLNIKTLQNKVENTPLSPPVKE